jgi:hypothetical protein
VTATAAQELIERPHDDVAFYSASRDVTLVVVEDAAHCHNFAPARTRLWDRIGAWATTECEDTQ